MKEHSSVLFVLMRMHVQDGGEKTNAVTEESQGYGRHTASSQRHSYSVFLHARMYKTVV
jgi:hypothetical protein